MTTSTEKKMLQKSFWWWVFIFGGLFLGIIMGVGVYFVTDVIKYYAYRDQIPDLKSPMDLLIEMYNYPKLSMIKILMGLVAGSVMGGYAQYKKRGLKE